jgi:uncharacterized protein GlcG (DUF336 family)
MLRDRFVGLPAPRTATDKARTALGFCANISHLSKSIQTGQLDARLVSLPRVTMLAGALIVETGGTLFGAIGSQVRRAATGTRDAQRPAST